MFLFCILFQIEYTFMFFVFSRWCQQCTLHKAALSLYKACFLKVDTKQQLLRELVSTALGTRWKQLNEIVETTPLMYYLLLLYYFEIYGNDNIPMKFLWISEDESQDAPSVRRQQCIGFVISRLPLTFQQCSFLCTVLYGISYQNEYRTSIGSSHKDPKSTAASSFAALRQILLLLWGSCLPSTFNINTKLVSGIESPRVSFRDTVEQHKLLFSPVLEDSLTSPMYHMLWQALSAHAFHQFK